MNIFKTVFIFICLGTLLHGATLDFRGGRILCAELSLKRPAVSGFVPANYTDLPTAPVYGALTVLCDRGRNLSIHDYGLEAFGKVYPCIAIRRGNGRFTANPDETGMVDPKTKYTLLFILDSSLVGLSQNETLNLKALFVPEKYSEQKVPFRNLKETPFTAPGAIPVSGSMPEKK